MGTHANARGRPHERTRSTRVVRDLPRTPTGSHTGLHGIPRAPTGSHGGCHVGCHGPPRRHVTRSSRVLHGPPRALMPPPRGLPPTGLWLPWAPTVSHGLPRGLPWAPMDSHAGSHAGFHGPHGSHGLPQAPAVDVYKECGNLFGLFPDEDPASVINAQADARTNKQANEQEQPRFSMTLDAFYDKGGTRPLKHFMNDVVP